MNGTRKTLQILTAVASAFSALPGCGQMSSGEGASGDVEVVASYPHDPSAFTQGLTIYEGQMYEGTGQYGGSSVRRVNVETGAVVDGVSLSARYFGEGITILDDRLYQLTWRSSVGFVYDIDTFEVVRSFRYDGEGWGLTNDGEHLIMSDGTPTIRYLDPETFEVVRRLNVSDQGTPIAGLNELELVRDEIWANIWFDDRIARISPETGEILAWVDLSSLYPRGSRRSDDVLNGIAFDPASERLFVTGKNWPQLFEIRVPR